jgi:hypothetical protein
MCPVCSVTHLPGCFAALELAIQQSRSNESKSSARGIPHCRAPNLVETHSEVWHLPTHEPELIEILSRSEHPLAGIGRSQGDHGGVPYRKMASPVIPLRGEQRWKLDCPTGDQRGVLTQQGVRPCTRVPSHSVRDDCSPLPGFGPAPCQKATLRVVKQLGAAKGVRSTPHADIAIRQVHRVAKIARMRIEDGNPAHESMCGLLFAESPEQNSRAWHELVDGFIGQPEVVKRHGVSQANAGPDVPNLKSDSWAATGAGSRDEIALENQVTVADECGQLLIANDLL